MADILDYAIKVKVIIHICMIEREWVHSLPLVDMLINVATLK